MILSKKSAEGPNSVNSNFGISKEKKSNKKKNKEKNGSYDEIEIEIPHQPILNGHIRNILYLFHHATQL